MNWIKQHKLIVTFLILALFGLLYVVFQDSITNINLPGLDSFLPESEDDAGYEEALVVLADLERISFDADFFDDPAFSSLFDFEQPIDPKPIGRRNPFSVTGL